MALSLSSAMRLKLALSICASCNCSLSNSDKFLRSYAALTWLISAVLRRRSASSGSRSGCKALASWRYTVRSAVLASIFCCSSFSWRAVGFFLTFFAWRLSSRRCCSARCWRRPASNTASAVCKSSTPARGLPNKSSNTALACSAPARASSSKAWASSSLWCWLNTACTCASCL